MIVSVAEKQRRMDSITSQQPFFLKRQLLFGALISRIDPFYLLLQNIHMDKTNNCFYLCLKFFDLISLTIEMSKNSFLQFITEVMLHAFNKRGFFTVPCRPGFFVRPFPIVVRR
jgi:hypothetical protein